MSKHDYLMAAYDQPWRHYHNSAHIKHVHAAVSVLTILQGVYLKRPGDLAIAIDLHDVVYVPGHPLNEEASALVAECAYPEGDFGRLIRLTKGHNPEPDDTLGILLCDADLLGLAAPWQQYSTNGWNIRSEIAAYTGQGVLSEASSVAWSDGRSQWLTAFLNRERVFHGPNMDILENRARDNMWRELEFYRPV